MLPEKEFLGRGTNSVQVRDTSVRDKTSMARYFFLLLPIQLLSLFLIDASHHGEFPHKKNMEVKNSTVYAKGKILLE